MPGDRIGIVATSSPITAAAACTLAGVFRGIAALVVGAPAGWPAGDAPDQSADELVLRYLEDLIKPWR
jgi:hypothetical protein